MSTSKDTFPSAKYSAKESADYVVIQLESNFGDPSPAVACQLYLTKAYLDKHPDIKSLLKLSECDICTIKLVDTHTHIKGGNQLDVLSILDRSYRSDKGSKIGFPGNPIVEINARVKVVQIERQKSQPWLVKLALLSGGIQFKNTSKDIHGFDFFSSSLWGVSDDKQEERPVGVFFSDSELQIEVAKPLNMDKEMDKETARRFSLKSVSRSNDGKINRLIWEQVDGRSVLSYPKNCYKLESLKVGVEKFEESISKCLEGLTAKHVEIVNSKKYNGDEKITAIVEVFESGSRQKWSRSEILTARTHFNLSLGNSENFNTQWTSNSICRIEDKKFILDSENLVSGIISGVERNERSADANPKFIWDKKSIKKDVEVRMELPATELVGNQFQTTAGTQCQWFLSNFKSDPNFDIANTPASWVQLDFEEPYLSSAQESPRSCGLNAPVSFQYQDTDWNCTITPVRSSDARAVMTLLDNHVEFEVFDSRVVLQSPKISIYSAKQNDPTSVPNERHPHLAEVNREERLQFVYHPDTSPRDGTLKCNFIDNEFFITGDKSAAKIYLPAKRALIDPVSVTRGNLVAKQTVSFPLYQYPDNNKSDSSVSYLETRFVTETPPVSQIDLAFTGIDLESVERLVNECAGFFMELSPTQDKKQGGLQKEESVVVRIISAAAIDGRIVINVKRTPELLKLSRSLRYMIMIGPTRLTLPKDVNHGLIPLGVKEFKFLVQATDSNLPTIEFDQANVTGSEIQSVLALHPWSEWGGHPKDWVSTGRVRLHHRNLIQEHAEFESSFEDRFPPEGPIPDKDGKVPSPLLPLKDFLRAVRDRYTEASGNLSIADSKVRNWLPNSNTNAKGNRVETNVSFQENLDKTPSLPTTTLNLTDAKNRKEIDNIVFDGQSLQLRRLDPKAKQPDANQDSHWLDVNIEPTKVEVGDPSKEEVGDPSKEMVDPSEYELTKTNRSSVTSRRAIDSSVPLLFAQHHIDVLTSLSLKDKTLIFYRKPADQLAAVACREDGTVSKVDVPDDISNVNSVHLARSGDDEGAGILVFDKNFKPFTVRLGGEGFSINVLRATNANVRNCSLSEFKDNCAYFAAHTKQEAAAKKQRISLWKLNKDGEVSHVSEKDLDVVPTSILCSQCKESKVMVFVGLQSSQKATQKKLEVLVKLYEWNGTKWLRVKNFGGLPYYSQPDGNTKQQHEDRSKNRNGIRSLALSTIIPESTEEPTSASKEESVLIACDGTQNVTIWKLGSQNNPKVLSEKSDILTVASGHINNFDGNSEGQNQCIGLIAFGFRNGEVAVRSFQISGDQIEPFHVRFFDTARQPVTHISMPDISIDERGENKGIVPHLTIGTSNGVLFGWNLRDGQQLHLQKLENRTAFADNLGVVRDVRNGISGATTPDTTGTSPLFVEQLSTKDSKYFSLSASGIGLNGPIPEPKKDDNEQFNLTDIRIWADAFKVRQDGSVDQCQYADQEFAPGCIGFYSNVVGSQNSAAGRNLGPFDYFPRLAGCPIYVTSIKKIELKDTNGPSPKIKSIDFDAVLINPDEVSSGIEIGDQGTVPSIVRRALSRGSILRLSASNGSITVREKSSIDWIFSTNRQLPVPNPKPSFPGKLARLHCSIPENKKVSQTITLKVNLDESRALAFGRLWPLKSESLEISGSGHFVAECDSAENRIWTQTDYQFGTLLEKEKLHEPSQLFIDSKNFKLVRVDPNSNAVGWDTISPKAGRYLAFTSDKDKNVYIADRTTGLAPKLTGQIFNQDNWPWLKKKDATVKLLSSSESIDGTLAVAAHREGQNLNCKDIECVDILISSNFSLDETRATSSTQTKIRWELESSAKELILCKTESQQSGVFYNNRAESFVKQDNDWITSDSALREGQTLAIEIEDEKNSQIYQAVVVCSNGQKVKLAKTLLKNSDQQNPLEKFLTIAHYITNHEKEEKSKVTLSGNASSTSTDDILVSTKDDGSLTVSTVAEIDAGKLTLTEESKLAIGDRVIHASLGEVCDESVLRIDLKKRVPDPNGLIGGWSKQDGVALSISECNLYWARNIYDCDDCELFIPKKITGSDICRASKISKLVAETRKYEGVEYQVIPSPEHGIVEKDVIRTFENEGAETTNISVIPNGNGGNNENELLPCSPLTSKPENLIKLIDDEENEFVIEEIGDAPDYFVTIQSEIDPTKFPNFTCMKAGFSEDAKGKSETIYFVRVANSESKQLQIFKPCNSETELTGHWISPSDKVLTGKVVEDSRLPTLEFSLGIPDENSPYMIEPCKKANKIPLEWVHCRKINDRRVDCWQKANLENGNMYWFPLQNLNLRRDDKPLSVDLTSNANSSLHRPCPVVEFNTAIAADSATISLQANVDKRHALSGADFLGRHRLLEEFTIDYGSFRWKSVPSTYGIGVSEKKICYGSVCLEGFGKPPHEMDFEAKSFATGTLGNHVISLAVSADGKEVRCWNLTNQAMPIELAGLDIKSGIQFVALAGIAKNSEENHNNELFAVIVTEKSVGVVSILKNKSGSICAESLGTLPVNLGKIKRCELSVSHERLVLITEATDSTKLKVTTLANVNNHSLVPSNETELTPDSPIAWWKVAQNERSPEILVGADNATSVFRLRDQIQISSGIIPPQASVSLEVNGLSNYSVSLQSTRTVLVAESKKNSKAIAFPQLLQERTRCFTIEPTSTDAKRGKQTLMLWPFGDLLDASTNSPQEQSLASASANFEFESPKNPKLSIGGTGTVVDCEITRSKLSVSAEVDSKSRVYTSESTILRHSLGKGNDNLTILLEGEYESKHDTENVPVSGFLMYHLEGTLVLFATVRCEVKNDVYTILDDVYWKLNSKIVGQETVDQEIPDVVVPSQTAHTKFNAFPFEIVGQNIEGNSHSEFWKLKIDSGELKYIAIEDKHVPLMPELEQARVRAASRLGKYVPRVSHRFRDGLAMRPVVLEEGVSLKKDEDKKGKYESIDKNGEESMFHLLETVVNDKGPFTRIRPEGVLVPSDILEKSLGEKRTAGAKSDLKFITDGLFVVSTSRSADQNFLNVTSIESRSQSSKDNAHSEMTFDKKRYRRLLRDSGAYGIPVRYLIGSEYSEFTFIDSPFFDHSGEIGKSVLPDVVELDDEIEDASYPLSFATMLESKTEKTSRSIVDSTVDFRILEPSFVAKDGAMNLKSYYKIQDLPYDPYADVCCLAHRQFRLERNRGNANEEAAEFSPEMSAVLHISDIPAFRQPARLQHHSSRIWKRMSTSHVFFPKKCDFEHAADKPGAMFQFVVQARTIDHSDGKTIHNREPSLDFSIREPQFVKMGGCSSAAIEWQDETKIVHAKGRLDATLVWKDIVGSIDLEGDLSKEISLKINSLNELELTKTPLQFAIQFNGELLRVNPSDASIPAYRIESQPDNSIPELEESKVQVRPAPMFLYSPNNKLFMPVKIPSSTVVDKVTVYENSDFYFAYSEELVMQGSGKHLFVSGENGLSVSVRIAIDESDTDKKTVYFGTDCAIPKLGKSTSDAKIDITINSKQYKATVIQSFPLRLKISSLNSKSVHFATPESSIMNTRKWEKIDSSLLIYPENENENDTFGVLCPISLNEKVKYTVETHSQTARPFIELSEQNKFDLEITSDPSIHPLLSPVTSSDSGNTLANQCVISRSDRPELSGVFRLLPVPESNGKLGWVRHSGPLRDRNPIKESEKILGLAKIVFPVFSSDSAVLTSVEANVSPIKITLKDPQAWQDGSVVAISGVKEGLSAVNNTWIVESCGSRDENNNSYNFLLYERPCVVNFEKAEVKASIVWQLKNAFSKPSNNVATLKQDLEYLWQSNSRPVLQIYWAGTIPMNSDGVSTQVNGGVYVGMYEQPKQVKFLANSLLSPKLAFVMDVREPGKKVEEPLLHRDVLFGDSSPPHEAKPNLHEPSGKPPKLILEIPNNRETLSVQLPSGVTDKSTITIYAIKSLPSGLAVYDYTTKEQNSKTKDSSS